MNARVLIVEDEIKLAELLRDYFTHAGFRVDLLDRGDGVETFVQREHPDLLILDLQLPGKDGIDVCRALRARSPEPAIIMVTARVDEVDRLLGLELGADDYICKPFSPREVVARAKAVLRRISPKEDTAGRIAVGSIEADRNSHAAKVRGQSLTLTPIEFELLLAFLSQPQRVWSRGELLKRACDSHFTGYERNIDSHVKNLRRKLKEKLENTDPIRSVYGVGYGLDAEVLVPS